MCYANFLMTLDKKQTSGSDKTTDIRLNLARKSSEISEPPQNFSDFENFRI